METEASNVQFNVRIVKGSVSIEVIACCACAIFAFELAILSAVT